MGKIDPASQEAEEADEILISESPFKRVPLISSDGSSLGLGQFDRDSGTLFCNDKHLHSLPAFGNEVQPIISVERLDASYNYITSLEGLEYYGTSLSELILNNNLLTELSFPCKLPRLQILVLNNNKLTDLDGILDECHNKLPDITFLSLHGNPVCKDALLQCNLNEANVEWENTDEEYQRYRYKVIYRLPRLKYLDSSRVTSEERQEAERKGPVLSNVIRPVEGLTRGPNSRSRASSAGTSPFQPLPEKTRKMTQMPRTVITSTKYSYKGNNSEGNRFIRDNDL